jgi:hypothetical protein
MFIKSKNFLQVVKTEIERKNQKIPQHIFKRAGKTKNKKNGKCFIF